ncbi:hypothetical protein EJ774_21160 [Pandoraea apista]|uniref:RNA polymerase sigma factor 70 region 4 type 2 domain-containing protein n=1 Tax=Pandoraea apista TaxID=93218 RepID=A0ABX9ZLE7_9BURK|nr:sigma-70 region 4 domain-containing protein [Pandoraea apista]RSK77867.1 hypothetical protein EJE83_17925 [Pandoraea apista]RUN81855.1 hypothetical protein EJ774_21160 [Pandoraea apista]
MQHMTDGRSTATGSSGWETNVMTDQELHLLCLQYGEWCRTRRFFAPPVPGSLLGQFQPPRSWAREAPDATLIQDMPFFNMAVHGLAEQEPDEAICFALFYCHGYRPVKKIAAVMGVSRATVYNQIRRFAARAHRMSSVLKRAQLESV